MTIVLNTNAGMRVGNLSLKFVGVQIRNTLNQLTKMTQQFNPWRDVVLILSSQFFSIILRCESKKNQLVKTWLCALLSKSNFFRTLDFDQCENFATP